MLTFYRKITVSHLGVFYKKYRIYLLAGKLWIATGYAAWFIMN